MAPDTEIVRDRLHRIRRYVRDLEGFAKISKEDFLRNTERQYAVLHALQLAIEASVEVAMHICSADGLGVPSTYAESFDYLERERIVDASLSDDLRAMARFRNLVVHAYADVDMQRVYDILTTRTKDFLSYIVTIERYLGEPGDSDLS
jgi:uncharacterized protein YutE (UPF0331/DUF86 family)